MFDGPFLGIISRVFDVRRDFSAEYFVRQFDIRSEVFDMCVSRSIFDFLFLKYTVVSLCRALRAATRIERSVFCVA